MIPRKFLIRWQYFLTSARRLPNQDLSCPACGSGDILLIKKKYLVTSLNLCRNCLLLFRLPKDTDVQNNKFYQDKYEQGFTTSLPDNLTIQNLMAISFRGTEKDYEYIIDILRAININPDQVILDFGSSWGYGSWQLRKAGFNVYSYEIGLTRARYSAEVLGCTLVSDPFKVPEKVDCLFCSHVIEHLPNPRLFWELASKIIDTHGVVVLFTPNGNLILERIDPARYHQKWGQVHPFLLSAESLAIMAEKYSFRGHAHTSPYDYKLIADGVHEQKLLGDELLFIAKHV
jgi:hypothetical protein